MKERNIRNTDEQMKQKDCLYERQPKKWEK